uniref:AMP-dependent synthetase/ligase domain-containing protein n=1 Tax=Rhizobium leguminosarum TaxID=384 RepID=A0A179C0A6_RHILE|nr:AMP-binding protein [Rhizobium leguminosarum]OAP97546.1 hypothetical protein A4U53_36680 [Rhizobium leguminosarum]
MRFLFDAIDREASLHPHAIAISDDAEAMSWADLGNAISNAARWMGSKGPTIGLLMPNGLTYVVAMLAAARLGKRLVPLPLFFSDAQLRQIVKDATVNDVVSVDGYAGRALGLGVSTYVFSHDRGPSFACEPKESFSLVIYTSGSSGTPKGVVHTTRQIETVVRGLATASLATSDDRYLSVLPLPMLLETICGVLLPLFCGARTHFAGSTAERIGNGDATGLADVIAINQPTATVLVPQLLRHLIYELKATDTPPPASLRFVAVGGAAIPRAVLGLAQQMGIPVFEGYGLSECCSVVALNRPNACRTGSVGTPLDGVSVEIDHGEIVVSGPSVMAGYLTGEEVNQVWRTGDLGEMDEEGFLTIHGRKDSVIVTSFGRNVSPEWVERALMGDPRIALAVVSGAGEPTLGALLILSPVGEPWAAHASSEEIRAAVAALCSSIPDYAVPKRIMTLSMRDAVASMLVTNNGRIIRCRAADQLNHRKPLIAAE